MFTRQRYPGPKVLWISEAEADASLTKGNTKDLPEKLTRMPSASLIIRIKGHAHARLGAVDQPILHLPHLASASSLRGEASLEQPHLLWHDTIPLSAVAASLLFFTHRAPTHAHRA